MRIDFSFDGRTPKIAVVLFEEGDDDGLIREIFFLVKKRFEKSLADIPGASMGETPVSIEEICIFLNRVSARKKKKKWPAFPEILLDLSDEKHVDLLTEVLKRSILWIARRKKSTKRH